MISQIVKGLGVPAFGIEAMLTRDVTEIMLPSFYANKH